MANKFSDFLEANKISNPQRVEACRGAFNAGYQAGVDTGSLMNSDSSRKVKASDLSEAFWSVARINECGDLYTEDEALEAVAKVCGCEVVE